MAGSGVWRRGRAVASYDAPPATIGYQTYLPVLHLRDAGLDLHLVARGPVREQREVDGVRCWIEPSIAAVFRRIISLRAELLFVDASVPGTLLGDAAKRTWQRNPRLARRPALRRLQRLAIRRFDALTFTNPALRDDWGVPPTRVTELPYPVHVEFWRTPWPRSVELWESRGIPAPTGPVLVYVGNLTRAKRQIELVHALAPLLRERRDMRLVLVGEAVEDGVLGAIDAAMEAEDVRTQVLLPGRLGHWQIRELYAWTTLSVIHTESETQCMALYESLAAGVPAVISDIPELTSQFGHLLAHRDDAELRTNVARLLDDPELGRHQVEAAAAQVATADWARHDEMFLTTVERLLGRSVR